MFLANLVAQDVVWTLQIPCPFGGWLELAVAFRGLLPMVPFNNISVIGLTLIFDVQTVGPVVASCC